MKILLTGHDGMLGSKLKEFWKQKHELFLLDKVSGQDINDCNLDYGSLDAIVHLAGLSGVRKSLNNAHSYWQVNVCGFERLMNAYPNTRILYASSSTAKEPFRNPYAWSKYVMENIAPLNSLGMRFTTIYGGSRSEMFIPRLLRGDVKFINDHVRDFIHVDDVVNAVDILVDSSITGVIDVGTGKGYHLSELVESINYKVERNICDWHERIDNTATPIELFKLGWKPKYDVKTYLTNQLSETKLNELVNEI